MAEPARHLHIVDADTGEKLDGCPSCAILEDQLKGADRDLRTWRARHADLLRDKQAEAEASKFWPAAIELFTYWQETCNHPNSGWSLDRFEMVEPFLKNRKYGKTIEDRTALCRRAIDGMAYDPFITTRKNGTKKRHDGWHLIFGSGADKFEECANKAPRVAA